MANEVAGGLHNAVPYHWEYADAAARTGATGFVVDDLGKWAHQADDHSFWLLTATTPTWAQIGTGGSGATGQVAIWTAATVLTGDSRLTYDSANGTFGVAATGSHNAINGVTATGLAVKGRATGAGGWGIYGYGGGAGGAGVVGEVDQPDGTPLIGQAASGQTADLLQLLVDVAVPFAIGANGRPRWVSTPPSSATDTGTTGEIAWDSGFLYVCISANTWKRVAISTW